MRRIAIFGSTGSIGCNTVDLLIRQGGAERYSVEVLTGGRNAALLAQQALALKARRVATPFAEAGAELARLLAETPTEILCGPDALLDAARIEVDWAMAAIVGAAGVPPTLLLAEQGCVIALANKESMVVAGPLLKAQAARYGAILIPTDSEHSAIFQALGGAPSREIDRIILTASGGPFRTWDRDRLAGATRAEALAHPNWEMGARITIDSASMFNKALEVIEAHEFFDVEPAQIEVVVHPQSIIHSMVGFTDGAVMAQMGPPDMRGPIGYALNYPDRKPLPVERLDLAALARLDFEAPDPDRFPALVLAERAMALGGGAGAVLNGAKEAALDLFLDDKIRFLAMAERVARAMDALEARAAATDPMAGLAPLMALDSVARALVLEMQDEE